MAGIAKSATTPAHIYWSLIGSYHSDQAITHPLKRGTAGFNIESMGSMDPHRQLPNQSSPSQPAGWPCCHWQHPSPMNRMGPGRAPAWILNDPGQRRVRVPNFTTEFGIRSAPIIPAQTPPAPRPAQGHTRNVEAVQAHTTDCRQSQPTLVNSYP